jgi:uncharacterized protein YpiB (UPF0302 family)
VRKKLSEKRSFTVYELLYSGSISLESLNSRVAEILKAYPKAKEFVISVEYDGDLELTFEREETDEEYAKRLKKNTRAARVKMDRKAKKEANERALLEKLRKKYGDS